MNKNRAIILLSGGLDSATSAAIARDDGFDLFAITFYYNQKHNIEIKFAEKLALFFDIKNHLKIEILSDIFKSALIKNSKLEIRKNDIDNNVEIPDTYVPARNIIFLSYALAYAESIDAFDIYIGANAVDYSGYPDCRPEFFKAYTQMANIGTKAGVNGKDIKIHTPLIDLKKSEIIQKGVDLGLDYSLTHSCYDPDENGNSCGHCDSCILRKKGFEEAGIKDPTSYID